MRVNADFSQRAIVRPGDGPWVASPQPGVERLMLDRLGAESGHATSLVRYAPGSRFPAHRHPGGEEILVLSEPVYDLFGVVLGRNRDEWMLRVRRMGPCPCKQPGHPIARFRPNPWGKCLAGRSAALRRLPIAELLAAPRALQPIPARYLHDPEKIVNRLSGTFSESGVHHGAGGYLRNPPGSDHQPTSREGATILVKLCQMPPGEQHPVRVDTRDPAAWQRSQGRAVCPLFAAPGEQVRLERLAAGEPLWPTLPPGGAELLVLEGDLAIDGLPCPAGSWARLPAGDGAHPVAGPGGALLYLKTGHLPSW